jgi:hypothetical protein
VNLSDIVLKIDDLTQEAFSEQIFRTYRKFNDESKMERILRREEESRSVFGRNLETLPTLQTGTAGIGREEGWKVDAFNVVQELYSVRRKEVKQDPERVEQNSGDLEDVLIQKWEPHADLNHMDDLYEEVVEDLSTTTLEEVIHHETGFVHDMLFGMEGDDREIAEIERELDQEFKYESIYSDGDRSIGRLKFEFRSETQDFIEYFHRLEEYVQDKDLRLGGPIPDNRGEKEIFRDAVRYVTEQS